MKKIISVVLLSISAYSNAGVVIYGNDTTILGLETNESNGLITSTLYGGSNDSGASSPADCVVKYKLTKRDRGFNGELIPFSTTIMSYGGDSKSNASFDLDKTIITYLSDDPISVCSLGSDFTGDYTIINGNDKSYKSDFDSLIQFNHTNALRVFQTKGSLEASELIESYIQTAIEHNYYYADVFNDYGYFLQQAGLNKQAINALSIVIQKSPRRVVAYLNIADAYWGAGDSKMAAKKYSQYVQMMSNYQEKIPQRAIDRAKLQ